MPGSYLVDQYGNPFNALNPLSVTLSDRASVGAHGNAWNAVAVLAAGVSNPIDIQNTAFTTVFGNSTVSSVITVQYSQDGTNWYNSLANFTANGDFGSNIGNVAARYVRLISASASTITATVAAKD